MKLILVGAVFLFITGTWWFTQKDSTKNVTAQSTTEKVAVDTLSDVSMPTEDDVVEMQENELETTRVSETVATNGVYQTYSEAGLAASTATHNVLIFSATWCPSCRALDKDITENLSRLPGNVALFTIDYDTNVALRQQYGVTTQHTLVLVETDGTAIKSWRGGNTLTALLAAI